MLYLRPKFMPMLCANLTLLNELVDEDNQHLAPPPPTLHLLLSSDELLPIAQTQNERQKYHGQDVLLINLTKWVLLLERFAHFCDMKEKTTG